MSHRVEFEYHIALAGDIDLVVSLFMHVVLLQPDHLPGDRGWSAGHGGCHGETSHVLEEDATRPRLDPHTARWVKVKGT